MIYQEMMKFPDFLRPGSEEKLKEVRFEKDVCLLRKDIVDHMLRRKDKEDYYMLDDFKSKTEKIAFYKAIGIIKTELTELGWKCELSYGDTSLFIYDGDKPSNLLS